MARLADGLGLRQDLLLEDIEGLSGGQRRRVDLIRILFQGPDIMILDEPTNHLDLPAKKWLMEELEKFTGAILVVSHDLKLLDRSINKVLHLSDGRLHEFKGTYSSYLAQLEADQSQRERSATARGPGDQAALHPGRLHAGQHQPPGPHRQVARQARRAARVVQDRGAQARDGPARSGCPPQALGRGPAPRRTTSASATARPPVLPNVELPCPAGRPDRHHRPQRGRQVEPAALPGRGADPDAGEIELGANVALGYFAQEHEQVNLDATVLENLDDARLDHRDRATGPAGLVRDRRQGGPPDAGHAVRW